MPEGDTIHRAARVIARVLEGDVVTRAEQGERAPDLDVGSLVGRRVESVEARGKNLVIAFDDATALLTHLGMTGSWQVMRPDEPWKRPAWRRSIALGTPRIVVVGFDVPSVERLPLTRLATHPRLARLGPDLLATRFDPAIALARFRQEPFATIAEALLDQRLASGIGNVYKSEVLFRCAVDPDARVADLADDVITRLLEDARALMLRNLEGKLLRTAHDAGGERHFVYGREGLPCRACGTPVAMRRHGDAARSTYFCPACQAASKPGRARVRPRKARR
jgi:endonuclease-8